MYPYFIRLLLPVFFLFLLLNFVLSSLYIYPLDLPLNLYKEQLILLYSNNSSPSLKRLYFHPLDLDCFDFQYKIYSFSFYFIDNNPLYLGVFNDVFLANSYILPFSSYAVDDCGYYFQGDSWNSQLQSLKFSYSYFSYVFFYLFISFVYMAFNYYLCIDFVKHYLRLTNIALL